MLSEDGKMVLDGVLFREEAAMGSAVSFTTASLSELKQGVASITEAFFRDASICPFLPSINVSNLTIGGVI